MMNNILVTVKNITGGYFVSFSYSNTHCINYFTISIENIRS